MLKSNLCDYNYARVLVNDDVTMIGDNGTQVAFKICATFIKFTTKIDGTIIVDARDLDLITSMYNLLEYSSNYFNMTGNLWFY